MVVRIRFAKGPKISGSRGQSRRFALAFAELFNPVSVMVLATALWCLAADLKWTNTFVITSGLFSHWEVWLVAAAGVQLFGRALRSYGKTWGGPSAGT